MELIVPIELIVSDLSQVDAVIAFLISQGIKHKLDTREVKLLSEKFYEKQGIIKSTDESVKQPLISQETLVKVQKYLIINYSGRWFQLSAEIRKRIAKETDFSETTIAKVIYQLKRDGILQTRGTKKNPEYLLPDKPETSVKLKEQLNNAMREELANYRESK